MRQVDWHYDIRFRLNEEGDAFLVQARRTAEERNGDDVYQIEGSNYDLFPYEINVLNSFVQFLQQKMVEENMSLEEWASENKEKSAAAG